MSEWDQRQLCPDGGCTGVLGSDGTCKVCGKRGRAADASAPTATEAIDAKSGEATDFAEDDEYYYEDGDEGGDGDGDSDGDGDDEGDDEGEPDADEEGVATVGWTDRKLCPDGGCTGLIGDNGTCKVCGKSAA